MGITEFTRKNVKAAFERIEGAETIVEINSIPVELKIPAKFNFDTDKYQRILFDFTADEKKILETKNASAEKFLIDTTKLCLEGKLLYAMAWKQGDLLKLKHIVDGLVSKKIDVLSNEQEFPNQGKVFYQFGKHLADKTAEPIVDQHVLRAFSIYKNVEGMKDNELIARYKDWRNTEVNPRLRNTDGYYHIDKVLFTLGKYAKPEKKGRQLGASKTNTIK